MSTLKRIAIAVVAAAAVTVGSVAVVPPTSAMAMLSCEKMFEIYVYHWHLGWQYYALGDYANANHHWGRAEAYRRYAC